MLPINFKEQTKILKKPPSMTKKECGNLPVFNDGKISLSCWKGSFWERIKFLFIGRMWLGVRGGVTQPPVYLVMGKPFEENKMPPKFYLRTLRKGN